MASVGTAPDYTLTVWDWESESTLQRTKAFSQEVYRATFNPSNDGQLITSGMGHIIFWKMADTFTGLKLQGEIGKFGISELSDISAYVRLPNGKVLSGTESGTLLLWDGNIVQSELNRKGGKRCHDGMVEAIFLNGPLLLTAGIDGYVRAWDFALIDATDFDAGSGNFEMEPLAEILVRKGGLLRSLIELPDKTYAIHDAKSGIYKVNLQLKQSSPLILLPSGDLRGLDVCPSARVAAVGGEDGGVRLISVGTGEVFYLAQFETPVTYIQWLSEKTLAVGHESGMLRILKCGVKSFEIVCSIKPHSGPINVIKFSPDGKLIATSGNDKTIFFLHWNEGNLQPIGFIKLPFVAAGMEWHSPHGDKLLVFDAEQNIMQFDTTKPWDSFDTQDTFEISLESTQYTFKIPPKPKPQESEEENSEGKKDQNSASAKENSGEEEEEEAEKHQEEEEKPPTIISARYISSKGGKFSSWEGDAILLASSEPDVMFVINTEIEFPIANIKCEIAGAEPSPISLMRSSFDGKFMIIGRSDGIICVYSFPNFELVACNRIHDGTYGRLLHAALTFDGCFIASTSTDGNICISKMPNMVPSPFDVDNWLSSGSQPEAAQITSLSVAAASKEKRPSFLSTATLSIAEQESKSYSLQEAKLKQHHDKLMSEAKKTKEYFHKRAEELRDSFAKLLRDNSKLVDGQKLTRDELNIDPGLRERISEENKKKIKKVNDRHAWDLEYKTLTLQKLRHRFLDTLVTEHMTIYSFHSGISVSTFVLTRLTPAQQTKIDLVHSIIQKEEEARQLEAKHVEDQKLKAANQAVQQAIAKEEAVKRSDVKKKAKGALQKVEDRQQQRQQRQKEWDKYKNAKPSEKDDDMPETLQILEAQRNMGDYPLKMSPGYKVPEGQRVNAEKKNRQKILMEESLFNLKKEFNERVLAMRDRKKMLTSQIASWNDQLLKINQVLFGTTENAKLFPITALRGDEKPEERFAFDRKILEDYEVERKKIQEDEARKMRQGGGGGRSFRLDDDNVHEGEGAKEGKEDGQKETLNVGTATQPRSISGARNLVTTIASSKGAASKAASASRRTQGSSLVGAASAIIMSEVEKAEEISTRSKLTAFKESLISNIREATLSFDRDLQELRVTRLQLAIELKMADLKMILLSRELGLLKEFEKQDESISEKLKNKAAEKNDIANKLAELDDRLTPKAEEMKRVTEQLKELEEEMKKVVGESPFLPQLQKIFERAPKKKVEAGVSPSKQNLGDEDEDNFDFSDSEDEDDETSDACPQGCDSALYQKVLAMREKKFAAEEIRADLKKAADKIKSEVEILAKKAKTVESSLSAAEEELEQLQLLKQQKLNELDVAVMLKIDQLQHVVKGSLRIPPSMSNCVVFNDNGVVKLRERIESLDSELGDLNAQLRGLTKELQSDTKEKEKKEKDLKVFEEKIRDVQLLKFGQVISDINAVDSLSVNRAADEIRDKIKEQENEWAHELSEGERRVKDAMISLGSALRDNTQHLQQLQMLSRRRLEVETELEKTTHTQVAEYGSANQGEQAENEKLLKVIKLQQQEMATLASEINALTRKGGV